MSQGQMAQASQLLAPLLAQHPPHAEANYAMSMLTLLTRGPAAAEPYARTAHNAEPAYFDYHLQLLSTVMLQGRNAEAVEGFERLAYANAADPRGWVMLASTLLKLNRAAEAERHSRTARQHHPKLGEVLLNHATALLRIGEGAESLQILRDLIPNEPRLLRAWIGFASGMNYTPGVAPQELTSTHKRAAEFFGTPAPRARPANADPARRLRVGILSPDLRDHSVGYFVSPLLSRLAPHGLDITVLDSGTTRDAMNKKLRTLAGFSGGKWIDLGQLTKPADTESAIRAENLDIVIELSGFTQGQRYASLAKRPAPVQMTYLGYPATTGCPFIDFRLVDALTDPPGSEEHCVEALARIQTCFLCYTPPATRPGPRQPPDAPPVFGCFNSIQKYSHPMLSAWAKVLLAVPDSTLICKTAGFEDDDVCERTLKRLENLGIERDRVQLIGRIEDSAGHLDLYNSIDIALDSFPYHGTTTTCEALAMGVPVVSLVGNVHASRVGLSLLSAIGLGHLAAPSEGEFVAAAVKLASDREHLSHLHETLRDRLEASPLCDAEGFGKRFAAAVRAAWTQACRW